MLFAGSHRAEGGRFGVSVRTRHGRIYGTITIRELLPGRLHIRRLHCWMTSRSSRSRNTSKFVDNRFYFRLSVADDLYAAI